MLGICKPFDLLVEFVGVTRFGRASFRPSVLAQNLLPGVLPARVWYDPPIFGG
jgi:hypothetical protein